MFAAFTALKRRLKGPARKDSSEHDMEVSSSPESVSSSSGTVPSSPEILVSSPEILVSSGEEAQGRRGVSRGFAQGRVYVIAGSDYSIPMGSCAGKGIIAAAYYSFPSVPKTRKGAASRPKCAGPKANQVGTNSEPNLSF